MTVYNRCGICLGFKSKFKVSPPKKKLTKLKPCPANLCNLSLYDYHFLKSLFWVSFHNHFGLLPCLPPVPQSQLPCLALWAIILAVIRLVTQTKFLTTTIWAPGDGWKRLTLQVPETQSKHLLRLIVELFR